MDIDYEREVKQLKMIAALYKKRSLLREAEHVYKTVISLQEKYLGFCHAEVALTCYQLAEVYSDLGQYALARPLYARAVEVWQDLATLNLIQPTETVFFMDALTALELQKQKEATADGFEGEEGHRHVA
jgi:tetratricopeptide (TPR) repeat protein